MPISVACPSCQAKLSAPDAAAGKRIKCKTCQFVVVVPAAEADPGYEVVERPAPPPARAAVPAKAAAPRKPVRVSEDDDETPPRAKARNRNRDDDEKPRKKSNLLLILLLVGGGTFALIAVVGVLAVSSFLSAAKSANDELKAKMDEQAKLSPKDDGIDLPPTPSVNWVSFENKATRYKASFPGAQPSKLDPLADVTDPDKRKLAEGFMKGFTTDAYGVNTSGRRYLIGGVVYPSKDAASFNPKAYMDRVDGVARELYSGATVGKPKWVLVNGHLGKDFVVSHNNRTILIRYLATKDTVYTVRVEGDPFMKENDATAKEFLEKFQPTGPNGPYTEADFATGVTPKKKLR